MTLGGPTLTRARNEFQRERQRAALEKIMGSLTGRSVDLLSFHEVYQKLKATMGCDQGLQEVPLAAIIGSVDRYRDFSRSFLPRQNQNEERWAGVKTAVDRRSLDALPPVKLYRIGEVYFVQDGHHRISVARQLGHEQIHAFVTEVRSRVPLSGDVNPESLILNSEYAAFLEYTQLDRLRPEADLKVTAAGQYPHFEAHIEAHRFVAEVAQEREIPWDEAVMTWYDHAYLPVVETIREQAILAEFPGRTEADLYLWISDRQLFLEREMGWRVRPEVAAGNLPGRYRSGSPRLLARVGRRFLESVLPDHWQPGPSVARWHRKKLVSRYSAALFADLLLPLRLNENSDAALEQALRLARDEEAQLHGLLLLDTAEEEENPATAVLEDTFRQRCRTAGVVGNLTVESGAVLAALQTRAALVDAVVMGQQFGGSPAISQALARRCPRPLLIVPAHFSPLARPLLVYDHSPQALAALFVAAYLCEQGQRPLLVLTPASSRRSARQSLTYAQRYLEMHEVTATFLTTATPLAAAVRQTAVAQNADLIILTGAIDQPRAAGLRRRPTPPLADTTLPRLICGR